MDAVPVTQSFGLHLGSVNWNDAAIVQKMQTSGCPLVRTCLHYHFPDFLLHSGAGVNEIFYTLENGDC